MDGRHVSLWLDTTEPRPEHPPLDGDTHVDVAVVGAGITGMTAALELARAGRSVAVIDQHVVAGGTTGHSTAKVTSQHGRAYALLRLAHGRDAARRYGQAMEWAKEHIAGLAGEGIECGFRRRPAYLYGSAGWQRPLIEREAEAAAQAGLPADVRRDDPAAVRRARRRALRRPGRVRPARVRARAHAAAGRGRRHGVRAHAREAGARGRAVPRRDRPRHADRRRRGRRDADAVPRPRRVLRPRVREPLLRRHRADRRAAAGGHVHQRGPADALAARARRRAAAGRRRGPPRRVEQGAAGALRGADRVRAPPLGRAVDRAPLVVAGLHARTT